MRKVKYHMRIVNKKKKRSRSLKIKSNRYAMRSPKICQTRRQLRVRWRGSTLSLSLRTPHKIFPPPKQINQPQSSSPLYKTAATLQKNLNRHLKNTANMRQLSTMPILAWKVNSSARQWIVWSNYPSNSTWSLSRTSIVSTNSSTTSSPISNANLPTQSATNLSNSHK